MKIGWNILAGGRERASNRLVAYHISDFLCRQGIDSTVSKDVNFFNSQKFDVVVTYDRGAKLESKVKILYIDDSIDVDFSLFNKYDAIVTSAFRHYEKYLVNLNNTYVIEEASEVPKYLYKIHRKVEKPTLVWFGYPDNLKYVKETIDFLSEEYKILIITKKIGNVEYEDTSVYYNILRGDIGLLPVASGIIDGFDFEVKSSNRLVKFMSLGMPAVISPIDSYLNLIGDSGFVANSKEEFLFHIKMLHDLSIRKEFGRCARKKVLDRYSVEEIANQWMNLFIQTLNREK